MQDNKYNHKYTIVGAGISGLFCAYKLIQKGERNIIILEKNDYLGGRIKSYKLNNTYIEFGAGVINGNHNKILNLIKELGLYDKLQTLNSPKNFILNNTKYDNNMEIINDTFNKIIKKLTSKLANKEFLDYANKLSLYKLIKLCYGKKIAKIMVYKFGYHSDFIYQNAIDGLKMFEKDYGSGNFYKLLGGLTQIIDRLVNYIENNNVKIITNITVSNIIKSNNGYICKTANRDYSCKNIIMAIPKAGLKDIPYFNNINDLLNSVKQNSHIRIYTVYPKINGSVWFENMTSYSTNDIINNIIPYNVDDGIIMYYSDNKNAKLWHKFEKMKILDDVLHNIITNLFGQDVPRHSKLVISYKKIGTHMWKPGYNSEILYKKISKPYDNDNIFIIGEAYSNNQQWMLGALNSVDYLLDTYLLKN